MGPSLRSLCQFTGSREGCKIRPGARACTVHHDESSFFADAYYGWRIAAALVGTKYDGFSDASPEPVSIERL